MRQVLGHTSGIPDFGVFEYDLDTINEPLGSYSPDRMLSYVEDEVPLFRPGEGYMYSNTNYLLLALMIDHVTGASHADMITERIIEPLGLAATYYRNEPGYPSPPGTVNSYQDLAGDERLMNVSDLVVHNTGQFIGYTGLSPPRPITLLSWRLFSEGPWSARTSWTTCSSGPNATATVSG